jgi:nucleoside-diphosphate-sugar epimerase
MVVRFVPGTMRVRVAVAGGTGGLGRAIINGLLCGKHEVFVLSRKVIRHFLHILPCTFHHFSERALMQPNSDHVYSLLRSFLSSLG